MKTCTKCKATKPRDEFPASGRNSDGLYSNCKDCHNAAVKITDAKNPARRQARWRKWLYDLTQERYAELLEQQAGACAVCWVVPDGLLHVDHNHETGEVRGLLCGKCNRALGLMQENEAIVRCAADYLEEHNSSRADVNMPEEIATAA